MQSPNNGVFVQVLRCRTDRLTLATFAVRPYLIRMSRIRIGSREFSLPRSRLARMIIGVALVLGGIAGFLPVLGFWMIPLGLLILSVDLPLVRRWRRNMAVKLGRKIKHRYPGLWRHIE